MDSRLLAIISLRALAQLFTLQGQTKQADALALVAAGVESGADVDAHMRDVAAALEAGEAADWDDIHARITAEADRLRNRQV